MTDHDIKSKNSHVKNDSDPITCIKAALGLLQLFLPKTTARKLVCVILIAAGLSISRIAGLMGYPFPGSLNRRGCPFPGLLDLMGLSDRTVQSTERAVRNDSIGDVSSEHCLRPAAKAVGNGRISDVLAHRTMRGRNCRTADVREQGLSRSENRSYHTFYQSIKEIFHLCGWII